MSTPASSDGMRGSTSKSDRRRLSLMYSALEEFTLNEWTVCYQRLQPGSGSPQQLSLVLELWSKWKNDYPGCNFCSKCMIVWWVNSRFRTVTHTVCPRCAEHFVLKPRTRTRSKSRGSSRSAEPPGGTE